MRTIKKIHGSRFAPIADLLTYSPLPSYTLDQVDPFLLLNHHGPQDYPPHNQGLPFGPHPHRGMETVTFILEGDIMHRDSGGHESIIEAGGVQYMTAGRGLIHAEVSSEDFKEKGGRLEILQLWINLPSKFKMIEPSYLGVESKDIPVWTSDDKGVKANIVSGELQGIEGSFKSLTGVSLSTVYFTKGGSFNPLVPASRNVLFYVIRGKLKVGDQSVKTRELAEFSRDGEHIEVEALEDSVLLFGHAEPLDEPVVSHGPFVMNTEEEIARAYSDYREGKFGKWE